MTAGITREAVREDAAELMRIRNGQKGSALTDAEKRQCDKDVERIAERTERKAKGE